MTFMQTNTLLRDQERRVEMTYIKHLIARMRTRWTHWRAHLRHPHVRDLNAHHARDIGLTGADMARHKHQHPSQTTHHPRG